MSLTRLGCVCVTRPSHAPLPVSLFCPGPRVTSTVTSRCSINPRWLTHLSQWAGHTFSPLFSHWLRRPLSDSDYLPQTLITFWDFIPEIGPLLPRPALCQPDSPFPGGTQQSLTWEVVVCGLVLGHGGSSRSGLSAPLARLSPASAETSAAREGESVRTLGLAWMVSLPVLVGVL